MNHKLKTSIFKALDILPSTIGFRLYHRMQRSRINLNHFYTSSKKSFDIVSRILQENQESLEGKKVLEIGSGWLPIMPYLLKCLGNAGDIYSYDIDNRYENEFIESLNKHVKETYQFDVKLTKEYKGYHLPEFLSYFPNSNVITSAYPVTFDFVFSRFVMEHVTPNDIKLMHERFYKDLDKDGLVLHLISPGDHRSYTDSTISNYDFLQYSQKEWDQIQTKFDYHNRLRLPQYIELFENAGFEVVHLEYNKVNKDSKKYAQFKQLNLHEDYSKFSEEEILAGAINVLLKKK